MTESIEFNPSEHLQDLVRKIHNDQVKDFFKDFDDDNIDPDITTPRASLRTGCIIRDTDTMAMVQLRLSLFYYALRQAQDLQPPVYGMPVGTFDQIRRYRPQICLYFREPLDEVDPDFHPIEAEITFRLMDESETSLTNTKLTTIANKVKLEFASGIAYKWRKGKTRCTYTDIDKGYALKIFAFSTIEAKELIGKVLDIQSHTPDWANLNISENDQVSSAYPTLPSLKNVLGKSIREPRRRPVGNVQFTHATCAIWGLQKPVALIDLRGRLLNTLVDP
jgi:hypothetical protein